MPQAEKDSSADLPVPGNDPVPHVAGSTDDSTVSTPASTHLVAADISPLKMPLINSSETNSAPHDTVDGNLEEESYADPPTPTDDDPHEQVPSFAGCSYSVAVEVHATNSYAADIANAAVVGQPLVDSVINDVAARPASASLDLQAEENAPVDPSLPENDPLQPMSSSVNDPNITINVDANRLHAANTNDVNLTDQPLVSNDSVVVASSLSVSDDTAVGVLLVDVQPEEESSARQWEPTDNLLQQASSPIEDPNIMNVDAASTLSANPNTVDQLRFDNNPSLNNSTTSIIAESNPSESNKR